VIEKARKRGVKRREGKEEGQVERTNEEGEGGGEREREK
jgi:hypothetical protein